MEIPTLRLRMKHLLGWSVLLFISFTNAVYARASTTIAASGFSMDVYGDLNYGIVALFSLAGGAIAAIIPTAIDKQMKYNPAWSKMLIGFLFSFSLCWTADRHYEQYTALDFVFPALIAAAIGTPMMVYLINIANDPQTWVAVVNWVKARLGINS